MGRARARRWGSGRGEGGSGFANATPHATIGERLREQARRPVALVVRATGASRLARSDSACRIPVSQCPRRSRRQRSCPPGLLASVITIAVSISSACERGTARVSPTTPTVSPHEVMFRLVHSERGDTGVVVSRAASDDGVVQLHLSDLRVAGTDPYRAVVLMSGASGRVGPFVASTRNGTLVVPVGSSSNYDLVLMSTEGGANYGCLDYCPACHGLRPFRYVSMRLAAEGEDVHGYLARLASDFPFRYAAEAFNDALSVPGVSLGRIDFGTVAPTTLIGAWATIPASGLGFPDAALIHYRFGDPDANTCLPTCESGTTPYEYNLRYASALALHELAHTYLSAPDFDNRPGCATNGSGNLLCVLIDCRDVSGYPVLSSAGKDAIRYWALMNHRPEAP